ncbi:MAG: extracellular solute-binding protein [Simkaniaceae bacterium]
MMTRFFILFAWVSFLFGVLLWPKQSFFSQKEENTLHLFSWGSNFDEETIQKFENLYNCRVKNHSYASNEEMITKLKATNGKGYDLIMPSDYAVRTLINEGLIKKLDYSRLNFVERLNPLLLGTEFDPRNKYSLPLQWDVLGLGVDKTRLNEKNYSWTHVFEKLNYSIVMVNDPVEAVTLAAHFLFGHKETINHQEKNQIRDLLKEQKRHVEAYVESRPDYLLGTKNCALSVSPASYIWRLEMERNFVQFHLPSDDLFLLIENIAIPVGSNKDELIYAFINYIYEVETLEKTCNEFFFMPPTFDAIEGLVFKDNMTQLLDDLEKRESKSIHFFRHLLPEKEIRELWIDVKS